MDKDIQKKLETLRKDLHREIIKEKSLSSPRVVELSQRLDEVLNSYDKALRRERRLD